MQPVFNRSFPGQHPAQQSLKLELRHTTNVHPFRLRSRHNALSHQSEQRATIVVHGPVQITRDDWQS